MAETVDLVPANVDGQVVYAVPVQLTTEALRFWLAVLVLLALVAALPAKEDRP
jgi:hypothetical protein